MSGFTDSIASSDYFKITDLLSLGSYSFFDPGRAHWPGVKPLVIAVAVSIMAQV